jgi:hypothetical protein
MQLPPAAKKLCILEKLRKKLYLRVQYMKQVIGALVPCLVPELLKLQITVNHQKARNLDLSGLRGTLRY